MPLTQSQKRYLYAIYTLGISSTPIKTTEVSRLLGVTKASTVKMTQRLIDEGYIKKAPYREIELTESGIKAANELYTPSIIIENFLIGTLKVSDENAAGDTAALISQLSEETMDKFVKFILDMQGKQQA